MPSKISELAPTSNPGPNANIAIEIGSDNYKTKLIEAVLSALGYTPQTQNAILTTLAGLSPATDTVPYFTGISTVSVASLTVFARSLLASADAASVRDLLDVTDSVVATFNSRTGTVVLLSGDLDGLDGSGLINVGGGIDNLPADNYLDLAFAIADAEGQVAFGIKRNGNIYGVREFPVDVVRSGNDYTFPGKVYDSAMANLPDTGVNFKYVIVDSTGQVAFGIRSSGEVIIPVLNLAGGEVDVAIGNDGSTFYSQKTVIGLWQIAKRDKFGVVTQLTERGNNSKPSLSSDDALITFVSDRDGANIPYKMSRAGGSQSPTNLNITTAFDVNHVLGYGDSSMLGDRHTILLSNAQPYGNLMFNTGVRPGNAASAVSFQPLIATAYLAGSGTNHGESMANGLVDRASMLLMAMGLKHRILFSLFGEDAADIDLLDKRNPYTSDIHYGYLIAQATKAKALATAAGMSYVVQAVFLNHGVISDLHNISTYENFLYQLWLDLNADLKAISGQVTDIPLCVEQCAAGQQYANRATPVIDQQVLSAARNYRGKIILRGPLYQYVQDDTDHLGAAENRRLGETDALVYSNLARGRDWQPLWPRRIWREAKYIFIEYHNPSGTSLVFDTVLVTEPAFIAGTKYGFEYKDDTGVINITAAAIIDNCVKLTLAADPTGRNNKRVRYAFTQTVGAVAGPTTGARGNLRDSAQSVSQYGDVGGVYNWGVVFDDPVN